MELNHPHLQLLLCSQSSLYLLTPGLVQINEPFLGIVDESKMTIGTGYPPKSGSPPVNISMGGARERQ